MHYGSLNKTYLQPHPCSLFAANTSSSSRLRSRYCGGRLAVEAWRRHLQWPEERQLWQAADVAVTCPDWWQTCSLFLPANIWESKEPDTHPDSRGRMKVERHKEREGLQRGGRRVVFSFFSLPFFSFKSPHLSCSKDIHGTYTGGASIAYFNGGHLDSYKREASVTNNINNGSIPLKVSVRHAGESACTIPGLWNWLT